VKRSVVYDAAGVEASHRAIRLQHGQPRIARPQRRAARWRSPRRRSSAPRLRVGPRCAPCA